MTTNETTGAAAVPTKNLTSLRKNGVRTMDFLSSMSARSVPHTTTVLKLTTAMETTTCCQHRERPPDTKIKSCPKMTAFKSSPASNNANDSYKANNLASNNTVMAIAENESSLEFITTPTYQESRSSMKTKKTSQTQQQVLQRRDSVDRSSSNQSTGSKLKSNGAAAPSCKRPVAVGALVKKVIIHNSKKAPYSTLASLRRSSQPRQKANTSHGRWCLLPHTIITLLRHILSPHHHSPSASVLTSMGEMPRCSRSSSISSIKTQRTKFRLLPTLGATSFVTLLTLICLETVLLSTMSTCAKTFYMHWNTSNSIFRIDNTDHIIDVNKGNLAFEFDQVHIICPVYEPGTYENETEKYIIYNVSKVEYETCRITNADPRVIAICDKPQKLMFFTITFRPFTPQPGGLEFLPGNDYYFISTSSKDDLYRRIGGRCSTNNMKVVFKVCCAPEEKNKTAPPTTAISAGAGSSGGTGASETGVGVDDNTAGNIDTSTNINQGGHHMNNINNIGINGVNPGLMPGANVGNGVQLKPINGMGTSINSNIDQFNRIPIQPNVMGGNFVGGAPGVGGSGVMLSPGHMLPPNRGGSVSIAQYPGHHHVQTGIRINNVPTQQYYPPHKGSISNGKDSDDIDNIEDRDMLEVGGGAGRSVVPINFGGAGDTGFLPSIVDTNHSNIVQSTVNWPAWFTNITRTTTNTSNQNQNHFYIKHINTKTNSVSHDNSSIHTPSHSPPSYGSTTRKNDHHYNKHPNEVVKNEELTYNSAAASTILKQHAISWKQLTKFIALLASLTTTFPTEAQQQHMLDETTVDPTKHFLCYKCSELTVKLIVFIRNLFMSIHPLILLPILAKILIDCMCKYTLRKSASQHHIKYSNIQTRFAQGLPTDRQIDTQTKRNQTVCQTDSDCR